MCLAEWKHIDEEKKKEIPKESETASQLQWLAGGGQTGTSKRRKKVLLPSFPFQTVAAANYVVALGSREREREREKDRERRNTFESCS